MLKKLIFLALAFVFSLSIFTQPAFADDPISVYLDGRAMTFDVPPQLINSRTMVPLRAIFEAMGAKVDWDGDTETVTGTKDSTVVILKIGDTSPTINGAVVTIDQPGVIVDNRTLAPLRFVAEAFGGDVAWDGDTQTASITMGGTTPATPAPTTPPATTPPETTPPTQPPSGDAVKIVGSWFRIDTDPRGNMRHNNYIFRDDGTFSFYEGSAYTETYTGEEIKGKYAASGGNIYLTEVTNNFYVGSANGDVLQQVSWADMTIEYSFVTNNGVAYLNIPELYKTDYIDLSQAREYSKS